MKMSRKWAMANSKTFEITPIRQFILRYHHIGQRSVDPFANSCKIALITNDIDPAMDTDYNLDALDFLKTFDASSIDLVLFDPPYSPRQVSEMYKKLDKTVNMQTTQMSFWRNLKEEIRRIVKPGGYVLSFGWNSNGIGKKRGFQIVELMTVAHGGARNDTICTAEIKRTIF